MSKLPREIGLTTPPSGSWLQVERAAMERWAKLAVAYPRAASVMLVISSKMGRNNALIVSQRTLARIADCSRSTLLRSLEILQRNNWIEIRQIGPSGTTNAYIVNDRVAWSGKRDGIRYSLFSAAVLVSDDEQPDRDEIGALPPLETVPEMYPGEFQFPAGEGLPPPSQPFLDGIEPDLPVRKIDKETL